MNIRYGKMIVYSGVGVLMYYLIYRTMTYSGNITLSLIFFVIGSGCFGFAWDTVSLFVMTLAHGGENFYDGWMKNPKSAMISCNDGFRPVSFLLETLDEEAE